MASDEEENSTISSVLDSIGLGQYLQEFEENRITVEQVEMMSEADFRNVGVYHIGTRLKIKQACRNALQCKQDSTLDVFRCLQGKRKYPVKNVKRNHLKNESATRRIYLGWKHMATEGAYKVVNVNCGGGRQILDAQKNLTFRELERQILDIYFPNGRSEVQKMNVPNINYFVANFAGDQLPSMEDVGGFTVAKYFKKVKSLPVRLYLHTSLKKDSSSIEATGTSSDAFDVTGSPAATNRLNLDSSSIEATGTSSDAFDVTGSPAATNRLNLDMSSVEATGTSTDDFEDTGTPTVQFNRTNRRPRRNLSLSNCSSYSETNLQDSNITERSSFIEIIDSEDEAIETAILESLKEESSGSPSMKETVSLEQVLKAYQKTTINQDTRSDVIVFRGRVLESAFRAITRKSFKPTGQLYVKFSGEMGEDYGGPRREFFRLALKELLNSALFEGQEEEKYFSHDIASLDEGKYRLAGRLVALSIAQDGPGLHCLHPVLYDLMTDLEPDLSLASVPVELQQMIREVKDVDSDTKRDNILTKHMDWFIDNGFKDIYRQLLNQKDLLINRMMKHHMYYRTLAEIADFTRGLNDVGNFWELVTTNAELFKTIFCHKPAELTKEVFDGLCLVDFSDVGSNAKTQEDETVYSWEVLLQDIQEEKDPFTFEDLLAFMTGADGIPLCGFDKKVEIKFYDQEMGITRLPSVSTCGLQMWLPRGIREPKDLRFLLTTAVKGSQGFHKI